jgi:hypothetical protein
MPVLFLADDLRLFLCSCKPAFYDVAWQYVGGDFPLKELEEYIATHEPKSTLIWPIELLWQNRKSILSCYLYLMVRTMYYYWEHTFQYLM